MSKFLKFVELLSVSYFAISAPILFLSLRPTFFDILFPKVMLIGGPISLMMTPPLIIYFQKPPKIRWPAGFSLATASIISLCFLFFLALLWSVDLI